MFPSIFAAIAGTAPVALLCTAGILLAARLRQAPWSWRRAGLVSALVSGLLAVLALGVIASVFGDGLGLGDGLAAAAGGAGQAVVCTAIVALGARLVDRQS
jgi:hypothetical protein